MHDIDFLPQEYRQKHARRHTNSMRVLVALGFFSVVALLAATQYRELRRARGRLEAILPKHEKALEESAALNHLQEQLQQAESDAELLAYLRHPWPRSQILAALLKPLPDAIVFDELSVGPVSAQQTSLGARLRRGDRKQEEQKLASLPPAERDLIKLRDQNDERQTAVMLSGTTSDTVALHNYLSELGENPLISEADLISIEGDDAEPSSLMRFSAVLAVRPGYGQAGGPEPGDPKNQVATPSNSVIPAARPTAQSNIGQVPGRIPGI